MSKRGKNTNLFIIIFSIVLCLMPIMFCIIPITIAKEHQNYRNCRGIAIFCKQYYNVYIVTKETDTNYEYYYKSIKVKETNEAYYTIMIDWRTETEERHVLSKNQYVVVVSY